MTSSRRGFTLIEILVVITIIAALMGLAVPVYQNVQESARVTACQSNLKNIATTLNLYTQRNKDRWPRERGIKFLLTIARDDMIEKKDMKVFLCPGTNDFNGDEANPTDGSLYSEWDDLDPYTISYAGRDAKEHPINKNRLGDEVIAADDNDGRGNHRSATNFVYADGTPATLDLQIDSRNREIDLGEDAQWIPVGPDSPFEELQKLYVE